MAENVITETLKQVEKALDDYNGEYSELNDLCFLCHANHYNSQDGIIHDDECGLVILRAAISLAEKLEAALKTGFILEHGMAYFKAFNNQSQSLPLKQEKIIRAALEAMEVKNG